jgi:SpoVK/Ycf46/Vps4 family AAA+-type ATPase
MMAFDLDQSFIEKALSKVKAKFSNVIGFETSDPIRYRQIRAYLSFYGYSRIFIYDKWNGLGRYDSGKTNGVRVGSGDDYALDKQNHGDSNILDITEALRYMDKELKKDKSLFIIKDSEEIKESSELNTSVNAAVRSWAYDEQIISKSSLVVIISSNLSRILGQDASQCICFARPDISSPDERRSIIEETAKILNAKAGCNLDNLVLITSGLNLHQIEGTLLETYSKAKDLDASAIKDLKSEFIKRSEFLEIEEPGGGFEIVGGYQVVKNFIKKEIVAVLKDPERATKLLKPLPRGVILFGPPGTGKTLFAKALAKEANMPFINLKTENLYSQWLGVSGHNLSYAIHLIEQMSPAIVFIDEIDRFGKRKGTSNDGASEETARVFSQMLEWLGDKERKAIVLGTTNKPEHLDDAFIRTGRFDYRIPFLFPDSEARRQILEIHLGLREGLKRPAMHENEIRQIMKILVKGTEYFTGSDIEALVNKAKGIAFHNSEGMLGREDILTSLNSFKVDTEENKRVQEKYKRLSSVYTNDKTFYEALSGDLI